MTQSQVAEKVGVNHTYIVKIEKGQNRGSYQTLVKIAYALGVQPEELLAKAGFTNIPPSARLTVEVYEFSRLTPRMQRALLDMAPAIQKALEV